MVRHEWRQVQAVERAVYEGVQPVAHAAHGIEAETLQVQHQHIRRRLQVQLLGCLQNRWGDSGWG